VKTDALKFKRMAFVAMVFLIVLVGASALLYRQNKSYQFQNQRLIIVNDSILSENLELKNALRQKTSTVLKSHAVN